MRNKTILLAAAAALTLSAGAASAQVWMPMIERQAHVHDRIDAAVATGDMTPAEARLLRTDMAALVSLEGRYRWGGLSARERIDLDRRFTAIDDNLRLAVRASVERPFNLEDKKLALDARIERGLASGQLTGVEAGRLREDFDDIAKVEAAYRADGLSPTEVADLNSRFDQLAAEIRVERTDADRTYGWNRY